MEDHCYGGLKVVSTNYEVTNDIGNDFYPLIVPTTITTFILEICQFANSISCVLAEIILFAHYINPQQIPNRNLRHDFRTLLALRWQEGWGPETKP